MAKYSSLERLYQQPFILEDLVLTPETRVAATSTSDLALTERIFSQATITSNPGQPETDCGGTGQYIGQARINYTSPASSLKASAATEAKVAKADEVEACSLKSVDDLSELETETGIRESKTKPSSSHLERLHHRIQLDALAKAEQATKTNAPRNTLTNNPNQQSETQHSAFLATRSDNLPELRRHKDSLQDSVSTEDCSEITQAQTDPEAEGDEVDSDTVSLPKPAKSSNFDQLSNHSTFSESNEPGKTINQVGSLVCLQHLSAFGSDASLSLRERGKACRNMTSGYSPSFDRLFSS